MQARVIARGVDEYVITGDRSTGPEAIETPFDHGHCQPHGGDGPQPPSGAPILGLEVEVRPLAVDTESGHGVDVGEDAIEHRGRTGLVVSLEHVPET